MKGAALYSQETKNDEFSVGYKSKRPTERSDGMARSVNAPNSNVNGTEKRERPLKPRTEEVYVKAAMLFREYGYQNTPLNSIGRELNIQKASLYYYIRDKETLLFNILDRTMDNMLANVGNLPIDDLPADEKLQKVIHAHVITASRYLNEFTVLLQDTKHLPPEFKEIVLNKRKQYEDIFRRILEEGISKKVFVKQDLKILVYMILGSCNWLYQWYSPEGSKSPDQIAKIFSEVFLGGILKKNC